MSSQGLLRTLLRTSSSAPTANDSPSPKISTSPSFSDFSFNASADFDDVDHSSNCTATPRSLDGRASMESMESHNSTPSALARRSIDAASLRAEMRGLLFGSKGGPGSHDLRRASVPTPAAFHQKSHNPGQAKPEATAASTAPEKARRRQKIDGMEFYEWAELIRSSSLASRVIVCCTPRSG